MNRFQRVFHSPVPINTQATFSLGQFGSINGVVSLQLPAGTRLPVHLELTVPVSHAIPVVFDQPVSIPLAEKDWGRWSPSCALPWGR